MEKNNLTILLKKYKTGLIEKQLLLQEISLFVYNYPLKTCRWQEDACSDFFCFFYPKIEKMIESFEIREVPFEAYLLKSIRMQLKTFAVRKKKGQIKQCMLRNTIFWQYFERVCGYCCYEEERSYYSVPETISSIKNRLEESLRINEEGVIINKTLKKRITMLMLKNIESIPAEQLAVMAQLTGCSINWLEKCRQELKIKTDRRMSRKKLISERRNRLFCRMYQMHQLYKYETDPEEKEIITEKIGKTKNRISELNRTLKNISQNPTHKDVASMMGIPKGSVDSGLYYLKIYLENK